MLHGISIFRPIIFCKNDGPSPPRLHRRSCGAVSGNWHWPEAVVRRTWDPAVRREAGIRRRGEAVRRRQRFGPRPVFARLIFQ